MKSQPRFQPSSPPITFAAGTRTSLKVTSAVEGPFIPIMSMGVIVTPGVEGGTSTIDRLR